MSKQEMLRDVWESSSPITFLDESDSTSKVVDGKFIIGRVVAECFFLNKSSRNKRFYTEELWRTVLKDKELKERLDTRAVYGSIGHDQEIDDIAAREGKFSHILSKMWISEENKGMGEFLILGTPTGQNLNVLLRAGGKIYLSTRAVGAYERQQTASGDNILAVDGFKLQTIDFVTSPGFLDAAPTIIESNQNLNFKEESTMPDSVEFVTHLKSENVSLKSERDQLITKQLESANTIASIQKELDRYKAFGSISMLESLSIESVLKDPIIYRTGGIGSVVAQLKQYEELGTVKDIEEALEKGEKSIEELTKIREEFGTVKDIRDMLSVSKSVSESFKETAEKLASYEALGTAVEFADSKKKVEELTLKSEKLESDITTANSSQNEGSEFLKTHGFENFGNASDILNVTNALVHISGRNFSELKQFVESALEFEAKVGSFDNAKKDLEDTVAFIEKAGKFEEALQTLKELHDFTENVGTLEQAKELALKAQEFVENVGPFDMIAQLVNRVEDFTSRMGSFDEIESSLRVSESVLNNIKESKRIEKAQQLSEMLRVNESKILTLIDKGLTDAEIADVFDKKLQSGSTYESFSNAPRGSNYLNPTKVEESKSPSRYSNQSLASRLMPPV